jgi:hypothetical protein
MCTICYVSFGEKLRFFQIFPGILEVHTGLHDILSPVMFTVTGVATLELFAELLRESEGNKLDSFRNWD